VLYSILDTFVVDTEAVDDRSVLRNPEASRFRIAILRLRSKRADLHETETAVSQIVIVFSILIQTACKAYRIGECDSEYLFLKGRCLLGVCASQNGSSERNMSQESERRHYHVVSRFWVEAEKDRFENMFVHD
jgi:hypothetical protein